MYALSVFSVPHWIAKRVLHVLILNIIYVLVQLLSDLNQFKIMDFLLFIGGESRYSDARTDSNAIIKVT